MVVHQLERGCLKAQCVVALKGTAALHVYSIPEYESTLLFFCVISLWYIPTSSLLDAAKSYKVGLQ